MLVRDVMTRQVVTVEPGSPVRSAAALLAARGFTALPVVDGDGRLVGIVTEADLLRARLRHDARSPLLAAELGAARPPATVAEVMTVDVLTAAPWHDVADLVERMRARGIRSVPVVEPGPGLIGIVSRRDVLATFNRADATLAAEVRRRLDTYAGPGRWQVEVAEGMVTLGDPYDDAAERHAAAVIAASVLGVLDVRVVPRPE